MNKVQDDDMKMVSATQGCMVKNETVWTANTIAQELVHDLNSSNIYLQAQHAIQMKGSKDETKIKTADHDSLVASLIKIKSGEIAYANSTKDFTVFNAVNKSNSDVQSMADDDLLAYATIVYDLAVTLGAKLIPYNILIADVTLLKTRLDAFNSDLNAHRNQQSVVVVATENIAKELTRIKGRLKNELDPLVETYFDIAPDFVNQYKSSRKIIHYGVHHVAPEATVNITVTDKLTGTPLRLVHILIVQTDEKDITDDNGASVLQLEKAGVYTLTFTKPAYQMFTQNNVELGVGDVLNLNIQLTAIV